MKKTFLVLCAVTIFLLSASLTYRTANTQATSQTRSLPEGLMNAEFKLLDGNSVWLANYNGRVVVLTLWASWCGPCLNTLKDLNKLNEEFADRNVIIVAITKDENEREETLSEVAKSYDVRFSLGWTDRKTVKAILGKKDFVPQVFVIGPDGNLQKSMIPYLPVEEHFAVLRQEVEQALKENDGQ